MTSPALTQCLGGVVPPISTPLTPDGRVDQASLLAAYRQADDIRSLNRELLDAATSSRVESAPAQLLDAA